MKSAMIKMVSRLLIVSVLALSFQSVQAGMIGTGQLAAASAQMERQSLARVMDRPEVANQLQTLGLDARTAQERLAAMTDDEVRSLASKVNSVPAGADGSFWGWVIVIAIVIWAFYSWKR